MKEETLLNYLFRHLYRIQVLSPIYTVFGIIITITFGVWNLISHRDIHPYIGLPIVFFLIVLFVLSLSYYLIDIRQIQWNQKRAEFTYNPVLNKALTPFQSMFILGIYQPIMEYLVDEDKERLQQQLEIVKRWSDKGFISIDDVPGNLRKFYKLKERGV